MCGRFTLQYSLDMLSEIFGTPLLQDIKPRYNIAPTQQVPVIRTSPGHNKRHLDMLKWGLIPSWAKDPSIGSKMINARSETVHEKPSFRTSLEHRRCIVPASGFYEWREEGGKKHPLYIRLKDNNLMLFAGLWDHWKNPENEVIESFTILTTTTNELIKPLHDRMPVILDVKDIDLWLDNQVADPERLKPLFTPYPSDLMEMYPVSDLVNSPRNDTPECIEPISRN
jgi:putative SOS response-associated peptidase YedK